MIVPVSKADKSNIENSTVCAPAFEGLQKLIERQGEFLKTAKIIVDCLRDINYENKEYIDNLDNLEKYFSGKLQIPSDKTEYDVYRTYFSAVADVYRLAYMFLRNNLSDKIEDLKKAKTLKLFSSSLNEKINDVWSKDVSPLLSIVTETRDRLYMTFLGTELEQSFKATLQEKPLKEFRVKVTKVKKEVWDDEKVSLPKYYEELKQVRGKVDLYFKGVEQFIEDNNVKPKTFSYEEGIKILKKEDDPRNKNYILCKSNRINELAVLPLMKFHELYWDQFIEYMKIINAKTKANKKIKKENMKIKEQNKETEGKEAKVPKKSLESISISDLPQFLSHEISYLFMTSVYNFYEAYYKDPVNLAKDCAAK